MSGLDDAFALGGIQAVVRELLLGDNPDPDEATLRLRWGQIAAALQKFHPDAPKSGFVEDDEAATGR